MRGLVERVDWLNVDTKAVFCESEHACEQNAAFVLCRRRSQFSPRRLAGIFLCCSPIWEESVKSFFCVVVFPFSGRHSSTLDATHKSRGDGRLPKSANAVRPQAGLARRKALVVGVVLRFGCSFGDGGNSPDLCASDHVRRRRRGILRMQRPCRQRLSSMVRRWTFRHHLQEPVLSRLTRRIKSETNLTSSLRSARPNLGVMVLWLRQRQPDLLRVVRIFL